MRPPPPSCFYANELPSVLQEQSFGIQSFFIITTTPVQATASVKLLEGNSITVKLTSRGYTIETDKRASKNEDDIFETVESLLQSASREYEMRRHETWVKELEKLLTTSERSPS